MHEAVLKARKPVLPPLQCFIKCEATKKPGKLKQPNDLRNLRKASIYWNCWDAFNPD